MCTLLVRSPGATTAQCFCCFCLETSQTQARLLRAGQTACRPVHESSLCPQLCCLAGHHLGSLCVQQTFPPPSFSVFVPMAISYLSGRRLQLGTGSEWLVYSVSQCPHNYREPVCFGSPCFLIVNVPFFVEFFFFGDKRIRILAILPVKLFALCLEEPVQVILLRKQHCAQ